MQGRALLEDLGQLVERHRRDGRRVEGATKTTSQFGRRAEGLLDGDLLVEDHADEQGKGIIRQEFVGFGILGEVESNHRTKATQTR